MGTTSQGLILQLVTRFRDWPLRPSGRSCATTMEELLQGGKYYYVDIWRAKLTG